jgi:hypothetical protein
MKKYLTLAIIGLLLFATTEAWSQASINPTKLTLFKKHNVNLFKKHNMSMPVREKRDQWCIYPNKGACELNCVSSEMKECLRCGDGSYTCVDRP